METSRTRAHLPSENWPPLMYSWVQLPGPSLCGLGQTCRTAAMLTQPGQHMTLVGSPPNPRGSRPRENKALAEQGARTVRATQGHRDRGAGQQKWHTDTVKQESFMVRDRCGRRKRNLGNRVTTPRPRLEAHWRRAGSCGARGKLGRMRGGRASRGWVATTALLPL